MRAHDRSRFCAPVGRTENPFDFQSENSRPAAPWRRGTNPKTTFEAVGRRPVETAQDHDAVPSQDRESVVAGRIASRTQQPRT